MTISPNPYVELLHADLHPSAIQQTKSRFLGTPAQQIEAALSTYRLLMINHIKDELRRTSTVDAVSLLRLADLASQMYLGRFSSIVGPIAIESYISAYRATATRDMPIDLIYALANQHAERMGKYFHETSREAMVTGFNRLVNQGVPTKVAADRVVDALGLTPRQMSGYIALEASRKTHSSIPRYIKAKALEYINRSLRRRLKTFGEQEEHNLDQQAQQVVWMWQHDQGMLSSHAQKVWITARDEKVCKVCGPMHNIRIGVTERFRMPTGEDLYVPGAHVNCRCEVKVIDPITQVTKAFFVEHEHPRARDGRFKEKPDARAFQAFLDDAATKVEPKGVTMGSVESRTGSVSMGAPVSMGSVRMGSVSMGSGPISMGQTKTSMQRTAVSMPMEDRVRMQLATKRVVMQAIEQTEQAVAPKRRVFYKQTVKLEKPVYAVLENEPDSNGAVELHGFETFSADQSQVELAAAQQYKRNIKDEVKGIIYNHEGRVTSPDGNGSVYAVLDKDDIYNVVAAVAAGEPGNLHNLTATVHWRDHLDHDLGPGKISYADIAKSWNIESKDFRVYILRVDEGHKSERGDTTPTSAHGDRAAYSLSGRFNTTYGARAQVGPSADITVLMGEPDAPVEEFGDHPE